MSRIGIPYADWDLDASVPTRICPSCGERVADDPAHFDEYGEQRDDVTDTYSLHWLVYHGDES